MCTRVCLPVCMHVCLCLCVCVWSYLGYIPNLFKTTFYIIEKRDTSKPAFMIYTFTAAVLAETFSF